MSTCTMTEKKALKYDMLKTYEQKVLMQRPIKKTSVSNLLKATLRIFLQENGIVLPPPATNKSILADMVIDLVSSEPAVTKKTEVDKNNLASKTPPAINFSVNNIGEQSLDINKKEPATVVGNGINALLPGTPASSASNTALQNNTPPAATNPWDNPMHVNINTPQAQTLQATSTASVTSKVSTATTDTVPAATAGSSTSIATTASTVVAGTSEAHNASIAMLEPCNAIYISQVGFLADAIDEGWDMPPACGCVISVKDITEHLSLPPSALEVLQSMIESSVQEIIEFLHNYGEENVGSGCRIHLLMQIRDLLEEESKAMPSTSVSSAVPSTSNLAGPSMTYYPDASHKRTYDVGPGCSSLPINTLPRISPFKVPKLASNGNLPNMTHTSSVAVSLSSAQRQSVSASTSRVKNIANIPAALGAPVEKTREEKAKELSQDFGMMMAQQMALKWSNPKLPIPLAYTSANNNPAAGSMTTASSSSASSASSVVKEPNPEKECCVCTVEERQIAFIPCGHAVCCRKCATKVRDCPMCRKTIKSRLNLFFS